MRILKYKLFAHGLSVIEMPTMSSLLAAGEQDHGLVVWAAVDEKSAPGQRQIITVFTGEETTSFNRRHLATVQMSSGLVCHVFDAGFRYTNATS